MQAFELNGVSKTSTIIDVSSIREVLSFFEFNDEISLPVTSDEQLVIYGIGDGVLTQSSFFS